MVIVGDGDRTPLWKSEEVLGCPGRRARTVRGLLSGK